MEFIPERPDIIESSFEDIESSSNRSMMQEAEMLRESKELVELKELSDKIWKSRSDIFDQSDKDDINKYFTETIKEELNVKGLLSNEIVIWADEISEESAKMLRAKNSTVKRIVEKLEVVKRKLKKEKSEEISVVKERRVERIVIEPDEEEEEEEVEVEIKEAESTLKKIIRKVGIDGIIYMALLAGGISFIGIDIYAINLLLFGKKAAEKIKN